MIPLTPPPRSYNDDHSIELEPRKPLGGRGPSQIKFDSREFMRFVRMASKPVIVHPPRPSKPFLQRCVVQVRYTKGGSVGKWYSHGYYIAREAVKRGEQNENGLGLGFSAERNDVPVADTMAAWRRDKDDLFFRMILSAELGDRLDLEQHTRDTIREMEHDLGTKLEWLAVVHRNTDNPHVHVVLRGRRDDGSTLRIDPEYIKEGIRHRAQEIATNQLGYRTREDILTAQRREVNQARWTGLDRKLKDRMRQEANFLSVRVDPNSPVLDDLTRPTEFHLECRLRKLAEMNLAQPGGNGEWILDPGFEKSLRTVQKTHDRLKIMAQFGVMASDPKLPFQAARLSQMDELEGKVLVHGQDEWSGNNFALVESVTGAIFRIPQTREIADARRHGNLEPGHYLRIKRIPPSAGNNSRSTYEVSDFGDAEELLQNPFFLEEHAGRLSEIVQDGWGGWLGRLRIAVMASKRDQKRGPALT